MYPSQLHYLIPFSCFTYVTSVYVYLLGSSMGLKTMEANKAKHANSEEVDETCSEYMNYYWTDQNNMYPIF